MAFENDQPVSCGAIKEYGKGIVEVKRMFVPLYQRSKGIASAILAELEQWAVELNFSKCILETGVKQLEALGLYCKHGYRVIPNYGQYENAADSICFEKDLKIT